MITDSFETETEIGNIEVMEKCGNLDRTHCFLVILTPNRKIGHVSPNVNRVEKKIQSMSVIDNTDVNIKFKQYGSNEHEYRALIPTKLFTF